MIDARWQSDVEERSLTVSLPIPDAKLSINGRARIHWAILHKLKQVVFRDVDLALEKQFPELFCRKPVVIVDLKTKKQTIDNQMRSRGWLFQRAEIVAAFTFPQRRKRDFDNLYGRVKPCIDTIVRTGLLPDDDTEHLELNIRCRVVKGVEGLRLYIREVPADFQPDLFWP